MKLTLVTAPLGDGLVVEPLELMNHSRIKAHREHSLLRKLLQEAQNEAETYTWRKFLKQVWKQYWDGFDDPLILRYPPLHSDGVSSLQYTDTNETTQTVSTDTYEEGEENGLAVIRRKYNQSWPTPLAHEDSVWAQYTCGWDTPEDVPEAVRSAIRIHAAWFYRNRESGEPARLRAMYDAFHSKLSPYSVRRAVTLDGQA